MRFDYAFYLNKFKRTIMSTTNQYKKPHYINGYKLSHNTIKSMNALRLRNHIRRVRNHISSFRCGCCHMLICDAHGYSEEATRKFMREYNEVRRYLHFLYKEFNAKQDDKYKEQVQKIENRKIRRKNKGCNKVSHGKRKSQRNKEKREEAYYFYYEKMDKLKAKDIRRKVEEGFLPEYYLNWI